MAHVGLQRAVGRRFAELGDQLREAAHVRHRARRFAGFEPGRKHVEVARLLHELEEQVAYIEYDCLSAEPMQKPRESRRGLPAQQSLERRRLLAVAQNGEGGLLLERCRGTGHGTGQGHDVVRVSQDPQQRDHVINLWSVVETMTADDDLRQVVCWTSVCDWSWESGGE